MDLNREFAELVGIPRHEDTIANLPDYGCLCGFTNSLRWVLEKHILENPNLDYAADPRLVLREMAKREDWPEFSERLFWYIADKTEIIENFCEVFILDTTGKLRDAAIKFMKEVKDEPTINDWQSLGDLKNKLVETHQWYDFYLFARGKIRNSELDQIYNSYETGFVNWLINPAIFIPLVDEFLKEIKDG